MLSAGSLMTSSLKGYVACTSCGVDKRWLAQNPGLAQPKGTWVLFFVLMFIHHLLKSTPDSLNTLSSCRGPKSFLPLLARLCTPWQVQIVPVLCLMSFNILNMHAKRSMSMSVNLLLPFMVEQSDAGFPGLCLRFLLMLCSGLAFLHAFTCFILKRQSLSKGS